MLLKTYKQITNIYIVLLLSILFIYKLIITSDQTSVFSIVFPFSWITLICYIHILLTLFIFFIYYINKIIWIFNKITWTVFNLVIILCIFLIFNYLFGIYDLNTIFLDVFCSLKTYICEYLSSKQLFKDIQETLPKSNYYSIEVFLGQTVFLTIILFTIFFEMCQTTLTCFLIVIETSFHIFYFFCCFYYYPIDSTYLRSLYTSYGFLGSSTFVIMSARLFILMDFVAVQASFINIIFAFSGNNFNIVFKFLMDIIRIFFLFLQQNYEINIFINFFDAHIINIGYVPLGLIINSFCIKYFVAIFFCCIFSILESKKFSRILSYPVICIITWFFFLIVSFFLLIILIYVNFSIINVIFDSTVHQDLAERFYNAIRLFSYFFGLPNTDSFLNNIAPFFLWGLCAHYFKYSEPIRLFIKYQMKINGCFFINKNQYSRAQKEID